LAEDVTIEEAELSVVFINPPSKSRRKIMRNFDCATESKANYLYQPYDFLLMSSQIPEKEKKSFLFIDAIAEPISEESLFAQLKKRAPSFIVVAMANTSWKNDFNFLKSIRELFPKKQISVFGDLFLEEYFRDEVSPYVDRILSDPFNVNFSEVTTSTENKWDPKYEGSLLKKSREITIKTPMHSSFLKPAYRWPFSRHATYTTVFTSWGCPYSCSYCIMNKFPNLYRQADEIIEEMKIIKERGIKEIYIGDRSFGLPLKNVIKTLDLMIENEFKFSWSTYFHPNQYDKALLEKMKGAGCHTIIVGIESHDQQALKEYGRHMKANHLQNLLKDCNKLGIDVCADFIIGLPGETKESILKTIKYSTEIPIDYASFNVATPLPGTSIRQSAIEQKSFSNEYSDGVDSFGSGTVIGNKNLSGEEIKELKNLAVRQFYFRPSYLFKRLTKIKSFQHLLNQVSEGLMILRVR